MKFSRIANYRHDFRIACQGSNILVQRITGKNQWFPSEIADFCARFFGNHSARGVIPDLFRTIRSWHAHKAVGNAFGNERIFALTV